MSNISILKVEFYGETTGAYEANPIRGMNFAFDAAEQATGRVYLRDVRESLAIHHVDGGLQDVVNSIEQPVIGGMKMTATEKVLKARFSLTSNIDGGKIRLYRRVL